MFRKPVKTYERKNRPFNSHPACSVTIAREEVPPERTIAQTQVESPSNDDASLDYDPFDTTFDRVVKDVIEHPVPADQVSEESYSDSSTDETSKRNRLGDENEDPLTEELFLSPLPQPQTRALTKVGERPRKTGRGRRVRRKREDNFKDENSEPNARNAETKNSGIKKKNVRKNVRVLQKRSVDEKVETSTKKLKYLDDFKVLRGCSVNLERLSLPFGASSSSHDGRSRDRNSEENNEPPEVASSSQSTDSPERESTTENFESSENLDEGNAGMSENPVDQLSEEFSIDNADSEECHEFAVDGKRTEHFQEFSASFSSETPKNNEQLGDSVDFEYKEMDEKRKRKLDEKRAKENFQPGAIFENSGSPKLEAEREKKVQNPSTLDEKSVDSGDFGGSDENVTSRKPKRTKLLKKPVVTLSRLSFPKRVVRRNFSSSTPIFTRVTEAANSLLRLSPIQSNLDEDFAEPFAAEAQSFALKSNSLAVDAVSRKTASSPAARLDGEGKSAGGKSRPAPLSLSPDPEPSGLLFSDEEVSEVSAKLDNSSGNGEASADGFSIEFPKESTTRETSHIIFEKSEESFHFTSSICSRTSSICYEETTASPGDSGKDPFMGFSEERAKVAAEESCSDKARNDDDDEWITISGSLNVSRSKILSETRENFEQLSSGENNSSDELTEFVKANESASDEILPSDNEVSVELSKIQISHGPIEDSENSIKLKKNDFQEKNRPLEPVVLLSRLTKSKINKFTTKNHGIDRNLSQTIESLSQLNVDENFRPEKSVAGSTSSNETWSDRLEGSKDLEEALTEMESLRVDYSSENPTEESSIDEKSERNSCLSRNSGISLENVDKTEESSPEQEISNASELRDISRAENSQNLSKNDESLGEKRRDSMQPVVLLSRLNDPYRITRRRKGYRDRGSNLSAISEIEAEKVCSKNKKSERVTRASKMDDIQEEFSQSTTIDVAAENSQNLHEISQKSQQLCSTSLTPNTLNDSVKEDKVVYLKPGKSWARSLSILNHVHSQEDLEFQARGKGKKWRQSVQNILEMQQRGLIQSCVKKNEDSKELPLFTGLRNSTAWIPGSSQPDTSRLFGIASPGRFIRRVSIRVVPDCKSFDNVKDTSFLEVYGINAIENKQTPTPRSSLKDLRKTLDVVPKPLSSTKPRDVVLAQCGQKSSLPFDECYPRSFLENCRKIGEGVYGEVFLYEKGKEKNVIKIIPIEGEMKINSERQKKFDEILSEIVIAKELHNLRFADKSTTNCFVEVKKIRCVKGKYPKMLIDLWKTFDEEKNSENDCPSIFEQDQLYIVLELGHGGEDLEAFVFQNAREAHALFMQTALALAVAEDSMEFEHRDLHWGNLLISRTDEAQIDFKLNNKSLRVASRGVKVSVIDFTLSRMSYQGCSIFNDLSVDEDLFVAQGEYQFEIYRLMRKKLENNWQRFEPYTNILWLHYVLDKMITAARYRRKNTKVHKTGLVDLEMLKNEILEYNSAVDFVTNCDKATRLQASRTSVSTVSSTT